MCEKGADYTLTDIEGNTPKDLAEKNGHSKCAKYLGSLMKGKLPRGATGNVVVSKVVVLCNDSILRLGSLKMWQSIESSAHIIFELRTSYTSVCTIH